MLKHIKEILLKEQYKKYKKINKKNGRHKKDVDSKREQASDSNSKAGASKAVERD